MRNFFRKIRGFFPKKPEQKSHLLVDTTGTFSHFVKTKLPGQRIGLVEFSQLFGEEAKRLGDPHDQKIQEQAFHNLMDRKYKIGPELRSQAWRLFRQEPSPSKSQTTVASESLAQKLKKK